MLYYVRIIDYLAETQVPNIWDFPLIYENSRNSPKNTGYYHCLGTISKHKWKLSYLNTLHSDHRTCNKWVWIDLETLRVSESTIQAAKGENKQMFPQKCKAYTSPKSTSPGNYLKPYICVPFVVAIINSCLNEL